MPAKRTTVHPHAGPRGRREPSSDGVKPSPVFEALRRGHAAVTDPYTARTTPPAKKRRTFGS
jgi:hypothetical protein